MIEYKEISSTKNLNNDFNYNINNNNKLQEKIILSEKCQQLKTLLRY